MKGVKGKGHCGAGGILAPPPKNQLAKRYNFFMSNIKGVRERILKGRGYSASPSYFFIFLREGEVVF